MLEKHVTTNPIEISGQLAGKVLIAMPGMGDPRFDQSVIYLCAHSDEGAMGLIVNKPAGGCGFGRCAWAIGYRGGRQSP